MFFYSEMEFLRSEVAGLHENVRSVQKTMRSIENKTNTTASIITILRDDVEMQAHITADRIQGLQGDVEKLSPRRRGRKRRRAQAQQACGDARAFQARANEAMTACCPGAAGNGGGHRILQAGDCELPDTCPSTSCANVFRDGFA